LIALATVASERSFNRAADQLGYVQSAISGQIAHLERAVGMRLLDRSSGTSVVELTDAGRLLLRHTDEILARYEIAQAAVASSAERGGGSLRVAGLDLLGVRRSAEVLAAFRQARPFARVLLEDSCDAEQRLADGALDVLVREGETAEQEIVVGRIDFALLVPSESLHAARDQLLSMRQLRALRPIVPGGAASSPNLRAQLESHEIERSTSTVPSSAEITRTLVASGLGVAIIPTTWIDSADARTISIDLSHLLRPSLVAVKLGDHQDGRQVAIEAFVHAVRENLEAHDLALAC